MANKLLINQVLDYSISQGLNDLPPPPAPSLSEGLDPPTAWYKFTLGVCRFLFAISRLP